MPHIRSRKVRILLGGFRSDYSTLQVSQSTSANSLCITKKLVKGGNLALQHEASLPVIAMNAQMDTKFIYNLKSNCFLPDQNLTIE